MTGFVTKAKTAIGTTKKVTGKMEVLKKERGELPSFKRLPEDLKGKILVCPGEISKSVLEKARALGVSGIVCFGLAEEQLSRLKKELEGSWSPALFALLILAEEKDKILDKIEGKKGTIEVKRKRLVVEG